MLHSLPSPFSLAARACSPKIKRRGFPPFSWTRPRRTKRRASTTQPQGGSGKVNEAEACRFGASGVRGGQVSSVARADEAREVRGAGKD
ncbi:hypothetical protein CXB51_028672 [Gossypium anomalum]|uniref:Uncharacterized protein n=1 Tax=Gossypium anomalum TaxID=47600 RepID=A0A8J5YF41_9ROSI|nr:hypothetical protein CXB51_028672 [Gossypium anomalum]